MTPIHIGMPVDFIIVQVLFRQPCCEDFMGQLPYHIEKTLSVHFLVHWLLQTFAPSSLMFQRSIYRGHSNLQLSRLPPSCNGNREVRMSHFAVLPWEELERSVAFASWCLWAAQCWPWGNPPLSYEYSIKIILEKWKDFSFECFINIYELSIIMGFIMTFSHVYINTLIIFTHHYLPSLVHLPFSMIPFFWASGTTEMCHRARLILLSPGNVLIFFCYQHSMLCGRPSWLAG